MSTRPEPSRSSSTTISDSLGLAFDSRAAIGRDGHDHAPRRRCWASSYSAIWALVSSSTSFSSTKPVVALRKPGIADVSDEHTRVQVALPRSRRVGELAEENEVGVAGNHPEPHVHQGFRYPVTFGDQPGDATEGIVGVPKRRPRGRLRDRGQVIRQSDQQQCIDDRGIRSQVTQATPGERERLAHGAGDDECGRILGGAVLRRWAATRTRHTPRRRSRFRMRRPTAGADPRAARSDPTGCWDW